MHPYDSNNTYRFLSLAAKQTWLQLRSLPLTRMTTLCHPAFRKRTCCGTSAVAHREKGIPGRMPPLDSMLTTMGSRAGRDARRDACVAHMGAQSMLFVPTAQIAYMHLGTYVPSPLLPRPVSLLQLRAARRAPTPRRALPSPRPLPAPTCFPQAGSFGGVAVSGAVALAERGAEGWGPTRAGAACKPTPPSALVCVRISSATLVINPGRCHAAPKQLFCPQIATSLHTVFASF